MTSSLSVSWQRIYNTGTLTVLLNYTLQILHIKSSLHSRTLATNSLLQSLRYRTELSTQPSWTTISVILEPLIILRQGPHRKHVPHVRLRVHWSVTSSGRGADDIENKASTILACWTVFTELLPGNSLIKFVTVCYIRACSSENVVVSALISKRRLWKDICSYERRRPENEKLNIKCQIEMNHRKT
jgi:hypothetical protein